MTSDRLVLAGRRLSVEVDALHGARLASVRLGGVERLVTASEDPLGWGAYPMVPFAGRVRDGRLRVGDTTYTLPVEADGHAIHGTVLSSPWRVIESGPSHARLDVELGPLWPFSGRVEHVVRVDDDVTCTLTIHAHESMPAQVGWHPWFVRPVRLDLPFTTMLRRDARGIPDGSTIESPAGPYDDCFLTTGQAARLTWPDGWSISVGSDCSHTVVYDQPSHALCVEPQSGPPNGVNDAPEIVPAGGTLTRTMRLLVGSPDGEGEDR